jgi:hypothetical protein
MPSAFGDVLADSSDYQADSLILKAAHQHASQEFMDVADYLIDCQNDNYHDVFMLDRFLPVWCNETAELLRSKLSNAGLKPKVFEKVLALLIKSDDKGTVQFAIELVTAATTPSQKDMIRPAIAACQLLYEDAASYWECVWSAVYSNSDFAGKVLDALAINPYGVTGELIQRLPECRLAEMYLWLAEHATTPNVPVYLKRQVLAHLANRGTAAACDQIIRLSDLLHDPELNAYLQHARELVRTSTWVPLTPKELIALAGKVVGADDKIARFGDESFVTAAESPAKKGGRPVILVDREKIKELRGESTQTVFARLCKISVDALQRAENDGRSSNKTIRQIVRRLRSKGRDISAKDLIKNTPQ